jgi:hypothetical protein
MRLRRPATWIAFEPSPTASSTVRQRFTTLRLSSGCAGMPQRVSAGTASPTSCGQTATGPRSRSCGRTLTRQSSGSDHLQRNRRQGRGRQPRRSGRDAAERRQPTQFDGRRRRVRQGRLSHSCRRHGKVHAHGMAGRVVGQCVDRRGVAGGRPSVTTGASRPSAPLRARASSPLVRRACHGSLRRWFASARSPGFASMIALGHHT